MESKTLKRIATGVVPVAAALTVAVGPANATAGQPGIAPCGATAYQPGMQSSGVTGTGLSSNCTGKSMLTEVYRWVNGSPVRHSSSAWRYLSNNQGVYQYSTAWPAAGCWTYYTKVSISNTLVERSSGKTICG